jgi:hypothetical protein
MKNPFEKYQKYKIKDNQTVSFNEVSLKLIDESFLLFKSLYDLYYGSIIEEDNLISIHTGGWSDNEELISQFKETWWWFIHHKITATGGHYYFNTNIHAEKDWDVTIRKY